MLWSFGRLRPFALIESVKESFMVTHKQYLGNTCSSNLKRDVQGVPVLYPEGTSKNSDICESIKSFWHWKWMVVNGKKYLKHFSSFKKDLLVICMSHFAYACKTEGKNGISHLISALCVNCLISIPEYSRIIDYSIIWMCIWCGLLQKLYKIKKSELLNSKVYSKV